MKWIRKGLVASVAAGALMLAGCAPGEDAKTESPTEEGQQQAEFVKKEPLVLGYSVYDLQNPYWQSYAAGVEAGAKDAGIEVKVTDQKSSQQTQVSGSLDLINQDISGLIITPVQPDALPATIDAAHNAKIPVVVADIGVAGDYDVYIQSNNEEGGKLAAEYMIGELKTQPGTKKVGIIELHAGSVVGEERVAGFKERIAQEEDFEIVSSLDGKDTVDGGFKAAQDMLTANPDLIGIYAANDASATGAVRAMESAGKSVEDGFILIGFDGNSAALQLIGEGKMSATIAQDPYGQGKKAVEIVLALLNGEDPGLSDAETRTVLFPVEVVSSENLSEIEESRANQN